MQRRTCGWLGDPLLHLVLIAALLGCLSLWRASTRVPEIGDELRLVSAPPPGGVPGSPPLKAAAEG